ncbi:autotransporter domain-containing protein [Rhodobacteraceae bacterium XHP0102]|nr:autotransporter domain-containing protein [Rhodobacteraceae bacterium XHP0102]
MKNSLKALSVVSIAIGFSAGNAIADEGIQEFDGISENFGNCSVFYEYTIATNSAYIYLATSTDYLLYFGVDSSGVFEDNAGGASDSTAIAAVLSTLCSLSEEDTFENVEYVAPAGTLENPQPFGLRFTYNDTPYVFAIGDPFSPAATPASEFAANTSEIGQVIVEDAQRVLNSTLAANRRMTIDARERFIEIRRQMSGDGSGLASRNVVDFDVDDTFVLNGATLSTSGEFFQQSGNYEGTQRRLFFGDFDVQHDSDTGSSTATLTARVAWEQMSSDQTMLGYFIGGELAHSNIDGAFEGDQDRVGVTAGGYAVHQLADQAYLDGFLSYGIGRNNLDMKNDVLALTSDYTTRTATAGAALSGVYEYERYEFRPELALSYGKTWIGNVGFTGRAYGLVDDTLSLDVGNVSIANLTLRPEVVWALDADTFADSRSQLSFAPRAICERTMSTRRVEDCGGGAELGLSSMSEDGLSNAEIRFVRDRVGNSYRSSFALNIEHRF